LWKTYFLVSGPASEKTYWNKNTDRMVFFNRVMLVKREWMEMLVRLEMQ
jgi:hypothetical protein